MKLSKKGGRTARRSINGPGGIKIGKAEPAKKAKIPPVARIGSPWDPIPGEGAKTYAHFRVYLDLGPSRTLEKTREKTGKGLEHLEKLSARNAWVKRAAHYDAWTAEIYEREREAAIKETARENVKLGNRIIDYVQESLDALEEEKKLIPIHLIPKYAETGVKIIKAGFGEDPSKIELEDARSLQDQVRAMSSEEIERKAREILDRRARAGRPDP